MEAVDTANGMVGHDCGTEFEAACQCVLDTLPIEISRSQVYCCDEFEKSRLADGFFGEVYKVVHRVTKKIMVMKVNKEEREENTMLEEIIRLSRLSHENVVRFKGVCLEGNALHLLTEYINGGNLEELLLNYEIHLEWSVRAFVSQDIASGMAYLHGQNLIHRDLTSKNCLIREANGCRYAVVADVGLSTELPKSTDEQLSVVGSPYNMAPELLRGERYDQKADVFSYGIILCEIIGRVQADPDELPRTNSFGLDVAKFQSMIGDCPTELLQVALCCCQIDPCIRPSFSETIKHLKDLLVKYPSRTTLYTTSDSVETRTPNLPGERDKAVIENDGGAFSPASLTSDRYVRETSDPVARPQKRRPSWIGGRYNFFHMKTDDLLENTPGKLKQFFHRVLRIQSHKQHLHVNPAKEKKAKEKSKKRSMSELRSFSPRDGPLAAEAAGSKPGLKRASFSGVAHYDSLTNEKASSELELKLPSPRCGRLSSSGSESTSPRITPRVGCQLNAHSDTPITWDVQDPLPSSNSDDEVSDLVDGIQNLRRHSTPVPVEEAARAARDKRSASCADNRANYAANQLSPAMANTEGPKAKGRRSPFAFLRKTSKHRFSTE